VDLMRCTDAMLPQGGARHAPHRHPAMHRIREDKAMTIPHSAAQRRGLRWRANRARQAEPWQTEKRPNWTKRAAKELRRRQRAVARCKRGSSRRRSTCCSELKDHRASGAAHRTAFN